LRDVSPGDGEVPVPPPVDEVPPYDRFCDLVMTGGVASGVVYPWAIVELARHYRFRSIGGTSVGAMAAVLAAAAEYGRRVGFQKSFEVLRRTPGALGEVLPDGRTRMWSLFQANPKGQRLVRLWGLIGCGRDEPNLEPEPGPKAEPEPEPELKAESGAAKPRTAQKKMPSLKTTFALAVRKVIWAYKWPIAAGVVLGLVPCALAGWFFPTDAAMLLGKVWFRPPGPEMASVVSVVSSALGWLVMVVVALSAVLAVMVLGGLLGFLWALWRDVRIGLIDNNLGLCKGGTVELPGPEGKRPGLSEWLHEGIQSSAGFKTTDRPRTFRDFWCAPAMPGAPHLACTEDDPLDHRSVDLQLITTNVTHGRPYRLPLFDRSSCLYYKPTELEGYLPPDVLEAMVALSRRYEKKSVSDPESIPNQDEFYELPGLDMPLVFAARLSLSFPLLFSAVPLWAIDYEAERDKRVLRRCLFTDGGVSSNFPVHLFDAAMPMWPTFGMWLDQKHPNRPPRPEDRDQDVWLPERIELGWGDNWDRFDPQATDPKSAEGPVHLDSNGARLKFLFGFLGAVGTSMKDWRDLTSMRLPHMRNRVARLRLERGEGGLHIGMSRKQILSMAHRYGTATGKLFVERYADPNDDVARAWSEQRWVRLALLIDGLKERLNGLKASAELSAYTEPLPEAIERSTRDAPLKQRDFVVKLSPEEATSVRTALDELIQLESELQQNEAKATDLFPKPELRLRAPL
jgi:predicted acylesterase/phospholipase RssA